MEVNSVLVHGPVESVDLLLEREALQEHLFEFGSSSKNKTPLCARDASPGKSCAFPIIPDVLME